MIRLRHLCWLALPVLLLAACMPQVAKRTLAVPDAFTTLDGGAPFLKVHLPDGGLYILADWKIDEVNRKVVGAGTQYDARRNTVATRDFVVAVDDVALFESNVLSQIRWWGILGRDW